jgi:methionine-rich copper-binding protein CopC
MTLRILILTTALLLAFAPGAQAIKTLVILNTGNGVADTSQRLMSSIPYDNQTLATAPNTVSLSFAQAIRPDKSSIKVTNMYGAEVDDGNLTADGTTLSIGVLGLPPGRYTVKWKARCRCEADSEIADRFRFSVQ